MGFHIQGEKSRGQLLYRQFFRNIEFSIYYRGRSLLMIGSGWDKPAAAIALHHSQLRKDVFAGMVFRNFRPEFEPA
jgi:hypothetical protein